MNVLLSVKPKYAEEITAGRKKYEFRRTVFKQPNVEKAYLYSSSPVSRITAEFDVGEIRTGTPARIWERCRKHAGISRNDFFAYFKGAEMAYAIEIGRVREFQNPIDPYELDENFAPPQSFYYVQPDFLQNNSGEQAAGIAGKLSFLTGLIPKLHLKAP